MLYISRGYIPVVFQEKWHRYLLLYRKKNFVNKLFFQVFYLSFALMPEGCRGWISITLIYVIAISFFFPKWGHTLLSLLLILWSLRREEGGSRVKNFLYFFIVKSSTLMESLLFTEWRYHMRSRYSYLHFWPIFEYIEFSKKYVQF